MQNSFCEECKRRALVEMHSGLNRSDGEKNIKVGWEIKSRQFGGTIREVYGFMDALDLEEEEKGKKNKSYTYLGAVRKAKHDRTYKAPNTMLN